MLQFLIMNCCVYTRVFYETPYLNCFLEHYISLGFQKIILLKADKLKLDIDNFKNYVEIFEVENLENRLLPICTNKIDKKFDWVLSVDCDEFLFLKNHNTIQEYVQSKINLNSNINIFYFRWAMIEKYDNNNFYLKQIIKKYKIYSNSHIKSMAKISELKSVWHPHLMDMHKGLNIYFENQILKKNKPNKHKLTCVSYEESVLIHIHTRSINNIITKSFVTKLGNAGRNHIPKKIKNKIEFISFTNDLHNTDLDDNKIFNNFKKLIGCKAELPFSHSRSTPITLDIDINFYENKLINEEIEKMYIESLLKKNNINIKNYYKLCTIIENVVNDNFLVTNN